MNCFFFGRTKPRFPIKHMTSQYVIFYVYQYLVIQKDEMIELNNSFSDIMYFVNRGLLIPVTIDNKPPNYCEHGNQRMIYCCRLHHQSS